MITWSESEGYIVKENNKLHILKNKDELGKAVESIESFDEIKVFNMRLNKENGKYQISADNVPLGKVIEAIQVSEG